MGGRRNLSACRRVASALKLASNTHHGIAVMTKVIGCAERSRIDELGDRPDLPRTHKRRSVTATLDLVDSCPGGSLEHAALGHIIDRLSGVGRVCAAEGDLLDLVDELPRPPFARNHKLTVGDFDLEAACAAAGPPSWAFAMPSA